MEDKTTYFIKLNNKIFRNTQVYLDKVLKKFELSNGMYQYLFILQKSEGISQNMISRETGNDKAMSARTITRLIDLGYVEKKEDERDSRACRLYQTEKARTVMPEIRKEIQTLISLITEDLSEEEKDVTMKVMKKIFNNIQRVNGRSEA